MSPAAPRVGVLAMLIVAAGLILVSCATGSPGPGRPGSPSEGGPDPAASASASTSEPYAAEVDFARAQVHERFGHPLDEIELVLAEPVRWPDASLGCPRTEREYDPAPVDGYRIVLRWQSVEFAYHGADGQRPFHCMFLDG